MTQAHTQIKYEAAELMPWTIKDAATKRNVATCDTVEDAQSILLALNSRAALVEALRDCRAAINSFIQCDDEDFKGQHKSDLEQDLIGAKAKAVAALALAEKGV